jgi:hypothetical protein
VRHTGKPAHLPIALHARTDGLALTFSDPLDATAAAERSRFKLKTWHLARSKNYGSQHLNEQPAKLTRTRLLNPTTVLVEVENFAPTQSYELTYDLLGAAGAAFTGNLHGTSHQLSPPPPKP